MSHDRRIRIDTSGAHRGRWSAGRTGCVQ